MIRRPPRSTLFPTRRSSDLKRGHEPAIRGAVEEARGDLPGHGERERVKILAMLDVVVHVFDDVFRKRRGQDAAVAKRAMTELRAAVEPGHNFVAREHLSRLGEKLFVARRIPVNDLAVVEDRLDLPGGETRAKVKMI